jgi:hypothetical protein
VRLSDVRIVVDGERVKVKKQRGGDGIYYREGTRD